MKILTVCLGNICRSPMAEGILRKKIQQRNLAVTVDSAGTSAYHAGELPDLRARETLQEFDIAIEDLRSRPFVKEDFARYDLILAMDEENYNTILGMAENAGEKARVKMLMNYLYPGQNISVPDPYFGGDQGFYDVYHMLDQATDKLLESLFL
ncbi:MAG: low molecular weight protein-tyrosine-phosphatase [Bacteroidota bacterium]